MRGEAGLCAVLALCSLSACTGGPDGESEPPVEQPTVVASEAVVDPVAVDLGDPGTEPTLPGRRLVFGVWGGADDEFGLYPDGPRGPASFDVTPDGRLIITDQQNHRLVAVDGKDRSTLEVGLPPLFLDLAVTNQEADVLVINGGRGGNDLLKRYGLDGTRLGTTVVGDLVGNVAFFDGELLLHTYPPDPEGWAPPGASPGSAASGIPTPTGGRISLTGGRDHHVTITRSEATSTRAWSLTSDANLGVVAVTATCRGVRAMLVHWTDTQRVYQYVDLDGQGLESEFAVLDDHYAEMTAGATFRFSGHTLYRAGTTAAGFAIYGYDLGPPVAEESTCL